MFQLVYHKKEITTDFGKLLSAYRGLESCSVQYELILDASLGLQSAPSKARLLQCGVIGGEPLFTGKFANVSLWGLMWRYYQRCFIESISVGCYACLLLGRYGFNDVILIRLSQNKNSRRWTFLLVFYGNHETHFWSTEWRVVQLEHVAMWEWVADWDISISSTTSWETG